MAWVDDRIWCHPKFTSLSPVAGWTWTKGCAFSAGMGTRGVLTREQQKLIGATPKVRKELVAAELWDEHPDGIYIHDWAAHNEKRDARRATDRERKRALRSKGTSAGQSAGTTPGQSGGGSARPAHVDGSEGSEGKERAVGLEVSAQPSDEIAKVIELSLKGAA